MIIIGSGLIATEIKKKLSDDSDLINKNLCFFASGTSNSQSAIADEFLREESLLRQAMQSYKNHMIIYFSSCALNKEVEQYSPYLRHKSNIEKILKSHKRFGIIRLPNLIGFSRNKNTLLNFINNSISNSQKLMMHKKSRRSIIDVEDAIALTGAYIKNDFCLNSILNIANPKSYSMEYLISLFEEIRGKFLYEYIDVEDCYEIELADNYNEVASSLGIKFDDSYLITKLIKYYGT
jgi:nucleoside-diphosphate-sugar epimerase